LVVSDIFRIFDEIYPKNVWMKIFEKRFGKLKFYSYICNLIIFIYDRGVGKTP